MIEFVLALLRVEGAVVPPPTGAPAITEVVNTPDLPFMCRVRVALGDATAETRIRLDSISGTIVGTAPAGQTFVDTTYPYGTEFVTFFPSHYKGGVEASGPPFSGLYGGTP